MNEFDIAQYTTYAGQTSDLEQLLLGIATLGLIGWGFIHSRDNFRSKDGVELTGAELLARVTFAIIFSGLIASAYNAVYMVMTANDIVVLRMEDVLPHTVQGLHSYYAAADSVIETIYYSTAVFVPAMSVASLVIAAYHIQLAWKQKETSRAGTVLVFVLWVVVGLFVAWNTWGNLDFVDELWKEVAKCAVPGAS